jgi:transglutaminase-like putative cysteine protease
MLTPRALPTQSLESHQIVVDPRPTSTVRREDELGNVRHEVRLDGRFDAVEISAHSIVGSIVSDASLVRDDAIALLRRCGVARSIAGRAARGQCRQLAEAALQRLRHHGCTCRYVSGYALADGRRRTLPHAWISMMLPDRGFVDYDPTSDVVCPTHVTLAWGPAYERVAPVAGTLEGAGRFRLVSSVTTEPL